MKKSSLPGRYAALFMVLLCCFSLTACRKSSSVTVTVAGKEITIKEKLQTCIDNGLITTDSLGEEELTLDTTLEGREISFEPVFLGNSEYPHKTPVYVNCFNIEESRHSVYNCSILLICYNVMFDNADLAPVLINGIDFWGMTEDEALDTLKAQKMKVDYDQMHQSHYNTFETGRITWIIESAPGSDFNENSKNPQKAVKEFDDETFYISNVEISIIDSLSIKGQ